MHSTSVNSSSRGKIPQLAASWPAEQTLVKSHGGTFYMCTLGFVTRFLGMFSSDFQKQTHHFSKDTGVVCIIS